MMSRDETRDMAVKRLKESLPEETREQLLRILTVLFPHHGEAFEGRKSVGEETPADTAARRGVGYAAGYDAYFGLHPSSDAIPKSMIDRIIASLGNQDASRSEIAPYVTKRDRRGQPSIGQLLEELRYRFRGRDRPQPTQEFLDVLFEFGEGVLASDWEPEVFVLSPRAQLSFLIRDLLEVWGQVKAGGCLIEAFKKCDFPAFCADVFVDRGRELGKFPDQSSLMPTVTEVPRCHRLSACDLIAAMADRGGPPQSKRPGHQLRAQFQSSNFGTRIRVAESRQHKTDNDLVFPAVIMSVRASA